MNWKAWVNGLVITFLTTAIATVNAVVAQMNPIPEEWKLFLVAFPVAAGGVAAFLMKSPFPGSTNSPPVNGGTPK